MLKGYYAKRGIYNNTDINNTDINNTDINNTDIISENPSSELLNYFWMSLLRTSNSDTTNCSINSITVICPYKKFLPIQAIIYLLI